MADAATLKPVRPQSKNTGRSLRDNLDQAKLALDYTKGKMTVGATNKFSDVIESYGQSYLCVAAMRSVDFGVTKSSVPAWLRVMAGKAEQVGCGNCGENAAVAFMFLYGKGIFPLDFMAGTNVDHAFVVIDRREGSDENEPKTWGDTAAVCDPWNGNYFAASEFKNKMYKGKTLIPESEFRATGP